MYIYTRHPLRNLFEDVSLKKRYWKVFGKFDEDNTFQKLSMIVAVDGCIGAGKTEFLKLMRDRLSPAIGKKIKIILEPSDLWETEGVLEKFYQDKPYYSFPFQLFAYVTRMEAIEKALPIEEGTIIILERTIFTDRNVFVEMLHDSGNMEPFLYKIYCKMWDFLSRTWDTVLPIKPTHHILLNTSLENSMKRIEIRAREGESLIPVEYQKALIDKHLEYFDSIKGPKFMFDSNIDYKNNEDDKDTAIQWMVDILK